MHNANIETVCVSLSLLFSLFIYMYRSLAPLSYKYDVIYTHCVHCIGKLKKKKKEEKLSA